MPRCVADGEEARGVIAVKFAVAAALCAAAVTTSGVAAAEALHKQVDTPAGPVRYETNGLAGSHDIRLSGHDTRYSGDDARPSTQGEWRGSWAVAPHTYAR
jgi:hypothetical protein